MLQLSSSFILAFRQFERKSFDNLIPSKTSFKGKYETTIRKKNTKEKLKDVL